MNNEHNSDIAGRGEFAIGFGEVPSREIQAQALEIADLAIAQLNRQVEDAKQAILESIHNSYADAYEATANVDGLLTGSIDRSIDRTQKIIDGLQARLFKSVDATLSELVGKVAEVEYNLNFPLAQSQQQVVPDVSQPCIDSPACDPGYTPIGFYDRDGCWIGGCEAPPPPQPPLPTPDDTVVINPPSGGGQPISDPIQPTPTIGIPGFGTGPGLQPPSPQPPAPPAAPKCVEKPKKNPNECTEAKCVADCQAAGGTWIFNEGTGYYECHFIDGAIASCSGIDDADQLCFKSVSDCQAFVERAGMYGWEMFQPEPTNPDHWGVRNIHSGEIHYCEGQGKGCERLYPYKGPCPKPPEAPEQSWFISRTDDFGIWIDRFGNTYGPLCDLTDCPVPDSWNEFWQWGNIYITFPDGKTGWLPNDGSGKVVICPEKPEEVETPTLDNVDEWIFQQDNPDEWNLTFIDSGENFAVVNLVSAETINLTEPLPATTAESVAINADDTTPFEVRVTKQINACDLEDKDNYNKDEDVESGPVTDASKAFKAEFGKYVKQLDKTTNIPFAAKPFMAVVNLIFGVLVHGVAGLYADVAQLVKMPRRCGNNRLKRLQGKLAFYSFMRSVGIAIPEQLFIDIQQRINYECQAKTPGPPALDLARLRKTITKKEWEFGTKLNGECLDWKEKTYKAATDYIPAPADLIHMMVRDVADKTIVDKLELSKDFEKKWDGILKEWSEKQGISEEVMLRIWQAHWMNIAPGQVYEMMHRLAADQNAKDFEGKPIVFTPKDAEELLKVADYPPAMIKYLMAISYKPIQKRDARLLYITKAIDDDGLRKILRQWGFDKDNVEIMVKGLGKAWALDRAKLEGLPGLLTLDKMFVDDSLTLDEYKALLKRSGLNDEQIAARIQSKELARDTADRKQILLKLRGSYRSGRMDDGQYRNSLMLQGVSGDRAGAIVKRDRTIKQNSNRQITAAKLCKLAGQGYLTVEEYQRRMVNLNFTPTDAALMISGCVSEIIEKRQKEYEATVRRNLQLAEKQERATKAAQREQNRLAKEKWPCKPAAKPTCQPGTEPPVTVN